MGTVIGVQWMDRLFLAVFLVMLAAVPCYGFLVAKVSRRWLVPLVYRFFSVWLVGFYLLLRDATEPPFWVACTFFVWVSVFNLFAVSLFWSVMADLFSSEQGKRLFGVIAAGGSLGGLASSLFVANYAEQIGVANLLLIPIVVLELALVAAWLLNRRPRVVATTDSTPASTFEPTGGGIFAGFVSVLTSRYLLGICLFLLLGKFCATAVYLQLMGIVKTQVPDLARRAELFAMENTAVQAITMAFQLFVTALLMSRLGLSLTLSLLPLGMIIGFLTLAIEPTLVIAFAVQVMQRSLAYGVANPAREVLFTVVSREQKYKAKGFMDTVVFRGGDAISSKLYSVMSSSSVGASIVTMVMVPAACGWAIISWSLGWQQTQIAMQQQQVKDVS